MAALSANEVACTLFEAGFAQADLAKFTAIAKAESGWDPSRVNPTPVDGHHATGLLQVVDYPDRASRWNLSDPLQNAMAAHDVFAHQGLGAWSTWPDPASSYLPEVQRQLAGWTPAGCLGSDQSHSPPIYAPGGGIIPDPGAALSKFLSGALSGGQVVLGVLVMAVGIFILESQTSVGRAVLKRAAGAAKTAAKAAVL